MLPGNADDKETAKSAAKTSPRRWQSWALSCDKENVLPKDETEKERRFPWMDNPADDMTDEEDVFPTPDLHGSSNIRATSHDTRTPDCVVTSLIEHHETLSRKQEQGLFADAVTPHREGVGSNDGTSQSRKCSDAVFLNNDEAVDMLTLPDEYCVTMKSVDIVGDKFTGSEESSFSCTCLQSHAHRPHCEDSYSEMDFTFHSTGRDAATKGSAFESCTSSPRRNIAAFSDTLARQIPTSCDDDSYTSDVVTDSTNIEFTFHTESSQVHIENYSDFRYTDHDSSSSILARTSIDCDSNK